MPLRMKKLPQYCGSFFVTSEFSLSFLCRNCLFGIPHSGIFTSQVQKLLMGTGFRNFSVCHDEDLGGIFYNRQGMSNHHNGLVFL